jgi:mannose-1-phosphate guanylyltransferase
MKIIIFAGGVGTRLWPLSRKHTPKQFEKIIGDKSTLQQTVDRLSPEFNPEDIFIATGARYEKIIKEQLPDIPSENFIFEPAMRDVGPAIGLVASLLDKKFPNEPIAILWSDHMVKNIDVFKKSLFQARNMVEKNEADFVFLAQKPRFANQNMGWIQVGDSILEEEGVQTFTFQKLLYRPALEEAEQFFKNSQYVWNLGYFVTTPSYLFSLFKTHAPAMHEQLLELQNAWGEDTFATKLEEIYPKLEKISFDDAILIKLTPSRVFVISADLGWSDVGAWEALKEALSDKEEENVVRGNTLLEGSKDALVFNYTNQLVVGIDLERMLVINTGDVLLVCPKTSVPKIKKLVEGLAGTPNEHLT